jgi:hypothetical protein
MDIFDMVWVSQRPGLTGIAPPVCADALEANSRKDRLNVHN